MSERPTTTLCELVFYENKTRADTPVHWIADFWIERWEIENPYGERGWTVMASRLPFTAEEIARFNIETWPELLNIEAWAKAIADDLNWHGFDGHPLNHVMSAGQLRIVHRNQPASSTPNPSDRSPREGRE